MSTGLLFITNIIIVYALQFGILRTFSLGPCGAVRASSGVQRSIDPLIDWSIGWFVGRLVGCVYHMTHARKLSVVLRSEL